MPDPTDVRVIVAYPTKTTERKPASRTRVVYETDDGLIGLAEGEVTATKPGKPMFAPQPLPRMREIAERVVAGDDLMITNPKTLLVLAAALVAVLETLCNAGDAT